MKRLISTAISIIALTTSINASAEPINHPLGSHLTTGPLSLPNIGISHTGNPAVGASMLYDGNGGFGIGVLGSFGMGLEIGPIENVASEVTGLQERLDTLMNIAPGQIPNLNDISALEQDLQGFLVEMGDSFYLDVNAAIDAPISPLVVTHTKFGSISVDINVGAKVKMAFLDSPLELNFLDQDNMIGTNSSMYLKAGGAMEVATTYSREIRKFDKGTLYGGATLGYHSVVLQKSLIPFLEYEDGMELLTDELNGLVDEGVTGNAVSLDLGVVWSAPYYRLGGTIRNINSPSISYPTVGKDCADSAGEDACYTAASFADRIDLEEKYTLNPQISIDAVAHTLSRTWFAGASLDLNPANDYVGDPYQWATISAGYSPHLWSKWFLMPGIRTGFRKNMSGTGMSYFNLGLTWMIAHLDVSYGLSSIDETKVPELQDLNLPISIPRSLAFNAGLHFMF